jgi:transcriptional regulator with XRE-family HTH domain
MLGELVRGYRRQLGMTQEELAAMADLSVRSIRKIEAGRVARPRPSTLRALADAFELPQPARVLFYDAPVVPVDAGGEPAGPEPASAHWSSADQAGTLLVVVTIDTTARRLEDLMCVQVRVRSEAGEYNIGIAGPGQLPVVAGLR